MRRGGGSETLGPLLLGVGDLLGGGVGHDDSGSGVDDDDVAVAELLGLGDSDDRRDALGPGEDRGVRRGTAVACDESEHLVEVEKGRVGRCEVTGDEDEGVADSGTPGALTPRRCAMIRWATSPRSAARSPM